MFLWGHISDYSDKDENKDIIEENSKPENPALVIFLIVWIIASAIFSLYIGYKLWVFFP